MDMPSLFNPVFHNVCNNLPMQNISPIVRIYNHQKNRKGFFFFLFFLAQLDSRSLSSIHFPFLRLPKCICEFKCFTAKAVRCGISLIPITTQAEVQAKSHSLRICCAGIARHGAVLNLRYF